MYAHVCTRPDITYIAGTLGHYQTNPGLDHWKAAKKVFRYLQGTKDFKLTYRISDNLKVVGYSDSDFAKCEDNNKSTLGYIFMVAGRPISWKNHKQQLTTTSTMMSTTHTPNAPSYFIHNKNHQFTPIVSAMKTMSSLLPLLLMLWAIESLVEGQQNVFALLDPGPDKPVPPVKPAPPPGKPGCNFPGAVCQDPRFVGGDGVTFYFHGHKDQAFCLLTDPNLHINGHFIGKRNPKLTRDFTWVQSIGILFDNHKLLVGAKKTSTWDDKQDHIYISFDNTPITLDGNYQNSSLLITRTRPTNGIAIEVQNKFRITANVVPIGEHESRIHGYDIRNDDCFAHLELGFKFYNLSDEVDGVLGQTYRRNYVSKIKMSSNMPVMGDIPKYSSTGIFATDCVVSQFGHLGKTSVTGEVF
ncbi:hypothetical protein E3N88_38084 [Mikania micrantha]|uniref:Uncharacterized protein n=1 Tax=Mikania micrantha TaxID=192012 RepID=A0A5N6LSZ3_9ASTR|nr:hypothetical protein E3N88_38084 [Mikania micrantha]